MDFQAKDWLPPLAALLVGSIAGLVAAMSAIIGKENKISEFRQAWIDAQRNDLATLLAEAAAFIGEADIAKKIERLAMFDAAQARTELRENPDKEEWTKVRALVSELRAQMLAIPVDKERAYALRVQILDASRPPLKANWTIVKQGEPWFRRFKNLIGVTVFAAVVFILTITLEWAALSPRTQPTPGQPDRPSSAAQGATLRPPIQSSGAEPKRQGGTTVGPGPEKGSPPPS